MTSAAASARASGCEEGSLRQATTACRLMTPASSSPTRTPPTITRPRSRTAAATRDAKARRQLDYRRRRGLRQFGRACPIAQTHITPEQVAGLVDLIVDGTISGKIAKDVLALMVGAERGLPCVPRDIVERHGLRQVTDHRCHRGRGRRHHGGQSRQGRPGPGQAHHAGLVRRPGHEGPPAARPTRRPSTSSWKSETWGLQKRSRIDPFDFGVIRAMRVD